MELFSRDTLRFLSRFFMPFFCLILTVGTCVAFFPLFFLVPTA